LIIMKDVWTRFAEKIQLNDENGCWEWTGCVTSTGYGKFGINGSTTPAHRAAYELFVGKVPKWFEVCHHCDNRMCVNPGHLFIGTHFDNMQDCVEKGRLRGGNHKLTEEDVMMVSGLLRAGLKHGQIASRVGVSTTAVWKIYSGNTWRHLGVYVNPQQMKDELRPKAGIVSFLHGCGFTLKDLSELFKTKYSVVRSIVRDKSWREPALVQV
jgi:hypothetical protein